MFFDFLAWFQGQRPILKKAAKARQPVAILIPDPDYVERWHLVIPLEVGIVGFLGEAPGNGECFYSWTDIIRVAVNTPQLVLFRVPESQIEELEMEEFPDRA